MADTRKPAVLALLILLIGGCVVLVNPPVAHACTCAPASAEESVRKATVVVDGTPVSREEDGTAIRYRVEVARSYKVRVPTTITVVTSGPGACGKELPLDESQVLVLGAAPAGIRLTGGGDEYGMSLCNNMSVTSADAERYVGPALDPIADSDPRSPTPLIIVGFLAAAALLGVPAGVLWWRRRHDPGV